MGMANLRAGLDAGDDAATGVSGLFRARYPEMVRLADLLGADDPEDIALEAFARLLKKHDRLRDPDAAVAYVRAIVCNLTRNRHRHLRVVRLRTPAARHEDSSEQAVILREDHREVLAALAGLPPRGHRPALLA
jgi:DNA-directed RNA polymerase specialized sigma24 family protein